MGKNGFTLIEIMVVVAIIAILGVVGGVTLSGRGERNAAMEVRTRVPMIISNAVARSFDNGERITINFEISSNRISVQRTSTSAILDSINLPTKLVYDMVDENQNTLSITSTSALILETGNLAGANNINLRVRDKQNNFVLRVQIRNIADTAIVETYTNGFNSEPTSRM